MSWTVKTVPGRVWKQSIPKASIHSLLVQAAVDSIEYENDIAVRWYPMGKNAPIVIDPMHASGAPTIPGRNVTVTGIHKRFDAGQRIRFISRDLALRPEQVEEVLRDRTKAVA